MTVKERLDRILKTVTLLNNEKIEAENCLRDDPDNVLAIVFQLFENLYPHLPSLNNQFKDLRNETNDALANMGEN